MRIEDLNDLLNELQTLHADIIKSAQERRYKGCTCICRKHSLCSREDQGNIGLNSLCGKHFAGFKTLLAHGELDNDVLMYCCKGESLLNHFLSLKRDDLGRDRTVNYGSNLLYDLFKNSSFLGNKGRIGGNAADNAQVICPADIVNICSVNKKLHNILSFQLKYFLDGLHASAIFNLYYMLFSPVFPADYCAVFSIFCAIIT